MEDIRQYIESGILELYVLDHLTSQEKREVEEYAVIYPEIKQELNEISRTMELFADHNAIEPRENLRDTIVNQLINGASARDNFSSKKDSTSDAPKIVPLNPVQQNPFYKYAFAASVALLLVSLIALFNTYNRLNEFKQQLVSLQAQNQKFANQVNFQQNQLNQLQNTDHPALQNPVLKDSITVKEKGNPNELIALENALKISKARILALENENKSIGKAESVFYDPDSRFIKLKTTGDKSGSALLLAWNPEKNKLYINKKSSGLAPNDKDHQYQLWAIRKLKPISLGVFNIGQKDSVIQRMMSIDKAAAFAVTLEPRGGSEKPTLKQMVAMSISHK